MLASVIISDDIALRPVQVARNPPLSDTNLPGVAYREKSIPLKIDRNRVNFIDFLLKSVEIVKNSGSDKSILSIFYDFIDF